MLVNTRVRDVRCALSGYEIKLRIRLKQKHQMDQTQLNSRHRFGLTSLALLANSSKEAGTQTFGISKERLVKSEGERSMPMHATFVQRVYLVMALKKRCLYLQACSVIELRYL